MSGDASDHFEQFNSEREQMREATVQQPGPQPASGDVWLEVIEDMNRRRQMGIDKYGTPLQAGNGRNSLVDAYQEALDLVVYLRQAIIERGEA